MLQTCLEWVCSMELGQIYWKGGRQTEPQYHKFILYSFSANITGFKLRQTHRTPVHVPHSINCELPVWTSTLRETARLCAGDDQTSINWPCSYFVPELRCQHFNDNARTRATVFIEALAHRVRNIPDKCVWLQSTRSSLTPFPFIKQKLSGRLKAHLETRWSEARSPNLQIFYLWFVCKSDI